MCLFDTTKNLDDIPRMFTTYSYRPIKRGTKAIKKDYKEKNTDMLFFLLVILIFYDNKV